MLQRIFDIPVHSMLQSELESDESTGPDDIFLESLKFANNRLSVIVSSFIRMPFTGLLEM